VSAEPVALIPQCEECNKVWLPTDGERWEARWIDDGPEEKLVFYCPECAEREFDGGWAPACLVRRKEARATTAFATRPNGLGV
jgi:hypothetical protein